jgi:flagellar hook-length control protein FliK
VALALIEGSDATGAAAAVVQALGSATTVPGNAAPGPALPVTGVPASPTVSSAGPVAMATLTLSDASAAASAGDSDKHAHGGAGDSDFSGNGGDSAAAAQQLGFEASSAAPADAPPAPLRVAASVDSAEFPQGLAERVSFMVDNNLNGARLQVNPPQLGPIELQIAVQANHAQIWMSTHSAVTREALESSLPKLREMLSGQGFGQVSVDISQRSFQERSAYSRPYQDSPPVGRPAAPSAASNPTARVSLSALDAYA